MNVKPVDLFFGLMEFLAFIVPGFILCITLPIYLNMEIPDYLDVKSPTPTFFSWFAFFMISYIIGHFIHHICAMILNPLYKITYFKSKLREHQTFITLAENRIKEKLPMHSDYLKITEGYLKLNHPTLVPELEIYEANSKLFRSLSLLALYLCFYPNIPIITIPILVIVSILSFTKFANQRWTHHFVVYQYFLLKETK